MSISAADSPLSTLQPSAIWLAFADLCRIPHPSGSETAIIAHIRARAEAKGFTATTDTAGNLIVRKPAAAGRENKPGVILQSHVDMVAQANSDTPIDFTTDPICPRIDGDWVKATGTTLGADNGMGVAAMIAVMEDDTLQHGPLEFLFTVEEEIGLNGAFAIKPGLLNGDILLNLDSEEDGDIVIGCAGGRDLTVMSPAPLSPTQKNTTAYTLTVGGLKGGHSGCEIHLGRGNAIRILLRLLKTATEVSPEVFQIADFTGGTARNAIPREGKATFVVSSSAASALTTAIAKTQAEIQAELHMADPNLTVTLEETALPELAIEQAASLATLKALHASPEGICRLSDTLFGIPETSSNLGVTTLIGNEIKSIYMVRSSINSARDSLCDRISDSFAHTHSTITLGAAYPGWIPAPNGTLLKTLSSIYQEQNNKPANITTLHAGLECAILGAAYPHWEMASIGPTIKNPHSPDECVEIATVGRFWNWLTGALKAI